jgi:hypothetical protein
MLDADLRYAQVIKFKAGGAIRKVKKKVIFGKDIDPKEISTRQRANTPAPAMRRSAGAPTPPSHC